MLMGAPAFAALQAFVWGMMWLVMTRDLKAAARVAGYAVVLTLVIVWGIGLLAMLADWLGF
jgi:hypothetical protein